MITITSRKDGFRRCGVTHPATATEYPDDRFTGKELKALQAEPMLTVEVTGDKDQAKTEADRKKAAEAKAKAEAEAKAKAEAEAKAKADGGDK